VWFAGFFLVLARYALGLLGLARLTRRARVVTDERWLASLASAQRVVGAGARVTLVESDAVGSPVTWGHSAPVIVLPAAARAWDSDRRRVVLLHELAHVARRDWLVQLGATVTCALYWFHPLTWLAHRGLRREAERACDDLVLGAGTESTDYATHLLGVARGARRQRLTGAVAIGMARHSTLEGRMLAIIDNSITRALPSRATRALNVTAFAALAVLLGAVRPVVALADVTTRAARAGSEIVTALAPAVTLQQGDSNFTKSVSVSRGGVLEIDIPVGGSVSIEGWDENRVEVRGRLAGRDWRDVDVSLERDRDGAVLRATTSRRNNSSTSNEFKIRVPKRFDVQLRSGGGSVTIANMEGTFRGSTGGGEVSLSDLSGDADLTTGGGGIHVSDSHLNGSVHTGGGNVNIEHVTGDLRGYTGGGHVSVDHASASVHAYSGSEPQTNRREAEQGRAAEARRETAERRAEEMRRNADERREEIQRRAEDARRNAEDRRIEAQRRAEDARREAEDRRREQNRRDDEDRRMTTTDSRNRPTTSVRTERGTTSVTTTRGRDGDREVSVESRDGVVHISKAGGSVNVERVPNGAVISTGGGAVTVGSGSGSVSVATGGGEVRVGPIAGSVRATTGAGNVDISIDKSDGAVNVTTGKGTVVIEVPRGFSGRIDLETAQTDNYDGRTPRITTPWDLNTETSRNWDDSQGTPRRYIRANGSVGRGSGSIKVRTVNGDIEIRERR